MKQLPTYLRIFCYLMGLAPLLIGCGSRSSTDFEQRWVIHNEGNGQYGYIDESGTIAIPLQFDYAVEFSEGMGGINIGGTRQGNHFPSDGKWGFVDPYGNYLINPLYDSPPTHAKPYDARELALTMHDGYIFSEGLAPVYKEGRWFYIAYLPEKRKDTLYISQAWEELADGSYKTYPIESARRFQEGRAAVYINGAWGYIDYWGKIIISPQFIYPTEFYQGRILAMDKNLHQKIYNINGERELPMYRIISEFRDGLAVAKPKLVGQNIRQEDEIKYALIDTSGKFMFRAQFDQMGHYGSGLAPVLVGSNPDSLLIHPDKKIRGNRGPKWGYVDRHGYFVHNPIYQEAHAFVQGVAAVRLNEYWGYIEPNGDKLTENEFLWAGDFRKGMAYVRLGPAHGDYAGLYAYLNLDGDVIYIQKD